MAEWDPENVDDQQDELMDRTEVQKAEEAMAKGRKKKRKIEHALFFEDEMGFKKLLKDFSSIRFRGKGYEKEDLKLMMRNYRQWFAELLGEDGDLEMLAQKSRNVLLNKEKVPPSDPKERLTELRCRYKNPKEADEATAAGAKTGERKAISSTPASNLSEEQQRRIAENRQKALDKKRQRDAEEGKENSATALETKGDDAASKPPELDMEMQWRIEQNRLKALEKKKQKDDEASGAAPPPPAPTKVSTSLDDPFGMEDDYYPEDDFGWDGGLDD